MKQDLETIVEECQALFGTKVIVGPKVISMQTTQWIIPLLIEYQGATRIICKVPTEEPR